MAIDNAEQAERKKRAARARAARAFANLKQSDLAEALGQSAVTIKRMEAGSKEITIDDLRRIADVCGVPHEFMDHGFQSVPDELVRIHARFDELTAIMGGTVAEAIGQRMMETLRPHSGNDDSGDSGDG